MRRAFNLILACALILAAGCGRKNDGSRVDGLIMDTDGTMLATTDSNVAQVHRNTLIELLRRRGDDEDAAVVVRSADKPVHRHDADDFGFWAYDRLALTVEVPSDFAMSDEDIVAAADQHYRPKMADPIRTIDQRLSVTVQRGADAASTEPAEAEAEAADQPEAPAGRFRSYTIQAGDTLADISAAFYGTSEHWRLIVEANPELDPARMTVGQVIRIPPKP